MLNSLQKKYKRALEIEMETKTPFNRIEREQRVHVKSVVERADGTQTCGKIARKANTGIKLQSVIVFSPGT